MTIDEMEEKLDDLIGLKLSVFEDKMGQMYEEKLLEVKRELKNSLSDYINEAESRLEEQAEDFFDTGQNEGFSLIVKEKLHEIVNAIT